jgi:CRISPR-associated protein Csb1
MTPAREVLDVELRPVAGSRFQPTGFPDLGAATFKKPDPDAPTGWTDALLVESAQSMANHLEATGWDRGEQRPVAALDGLPYIEVRHADDGDYLTSSRTEAHRLSSAFIREGTMDGRGMVEVLRERLGLRDTRPLAPREIARQIFALDPLCLLHGVFFSDKGLPGQPKIARAVSGFVEATGVDAAHSGGVKFDDVTHKNVPGGGSTEGYGTIPFHRTEYVAQRICASFVIDLAQLHAFGLPRPATDLLTDIARWEIRSLLDAGMRLRTACDLEPAGPIAPRGSDTEFPGLDELTERVRQGIEAVGDLLERREPWVVEWKK